MSVSNFYNVVARANFSLLQHAKVESWSVMCYEQRWHTRFIHANADAIARHARLRYFKYRTPDAVSIANADLAIEKSLHREILSKLAEDEVFPPEKAFPVVIGVHLINKNRALLSAMTGEIALPIAVDIELAHHSPPFHWRLPDRGAHGLTIPRHVAWKANIYRE